MTDNVIQFTDPNADPVQDKLLQAHDEEAARLGVEFTNFGWAIDEYGIASKTTKGILESDINANTMQVSHAWITYGEKARQEEEQKREMYEALGKSAGQLLMQQLRPLRQVYGDLTEFSAVWEAIDKLEMAGAA
jgi:hypothetical protein